MYTRVWKRWSARTLMLSATLIALVEMGCGSSDQAEPCAGAGCPLTAAGGGGSSSSTLNGGGPQGGAGACDAVSELCDATALRVESSWLNDHLIDPSLRIVDVRDLGAYQAGRIPGALHLNVGDVRTAVNGVSGQVADAATVASVLSAAGVRADATVVVYGTATEPTPARLVWTLHYYGHENARLLDGGFGAWQQAAYPVDSAPPEITPSSYVIDAPVDALRVETDWVAARLDDPEVVLVDARSSEEYGAGHIPGALSIDWTRNVNAGALLPQPEVAALHASIDPQATVVAYCQTGSRASVTYFVLRWLGVADVAVYDGSWAEWSTTPGLPVETD